MLGLGLVERLVVEGGRAVEAGERVLADLALQRGDLLIQAVDLIGDVLEEDIDLVDVIALRSMEKLWLWISAEVIAIFVSFI